MIRSSWKAITIYTTFWKCKTKNGVIIRLNEEGQGKDGNVEESAHVNKEVKITFRRWSSRDRYLYDFFEVQYKAKDVQLKNAMWNMDHFKTKILEEFNADLYRVLNLTVGDYRRMFAQHGENIDDNINKVFAEDGPSGLRRYLKGCVGRLDYLLTKNIQVTGLKNYLIQ